MEGNCRSELARDSGLSPASRLLHFATMRFQQIDQFAAELKADKRASVYQSTKGTHEKRTKLLFDEFADPNRLRRIAGEIKQHVIENLDTYLPAVEAKMKANGVQVHW